MKKFVFLLAMALFVCFTTTGKEKLKILNKGSTNINELVSEIVACENPLYFTNEAETVYASTVEVALFSNPTVNITSQVFGSENLLLGARFSILKKLQEGLVNPICWSNDGSFFNFFTETNYAARMTPLYKQMGPITVLKKPMFSNVWSFDSNVAGAETVKC